MGKFNQALWDLKMAEISRLAKIKRETSDEQLKDRCEKQMRALERQLERLEQQGL